MGWLGNGVGSKLAGGSFAEGAYSAAFFHLFNNEVETIVHDGWAYELSSKGGKGTWLMDSAGNDGSGPTTIAFYDSQDESTAAGQLVAAGYYAGGLSHAMIDIRDENWQAAFMNAITIMEGSVQRVVFLDHGANGRMGFGGREVTVGDLDFISPHVTSHVMMLGCNTFGKWTGKPGENIRAWARALPGRAIVGYSKSAYFSSYGAGTESAPTGPGGMCLHTGIQGAIRGKPIKQKRRVRI
jgi:hypothetical protein